MIYFTSPYRSQCGRVKIYYDFRNIEDVSIFYKVFRNFNAQVKDIKLNNRFLVFKIQALGYIIILVRSGAEVSFKTHRRQRYQDTQHHFVGDNTRPTRYPIYNNNTPTYIIFYFS